MKPPTAATVAAAGVPPNGHRWSPRAVRQRGRHPDGMAPCGRAKQEGPETGCMETGQQAQVSGCPSAGKPELV
jgi:hypothetical protein